MATRHATAQSIGDNAVHAYAHQLLTSTNSSTARAVGHWSLHRSRHLLVVCLHTEIKLDHF
uniref:Uncharacterized protein n=1 Tax=Arundo donax TaxID=35708 RepID=A0A0A8Z1M9_ARUDO